MPDGRRFPPIRAALAFSLIACLTTPARAVRFADPGFRSEVVITYPRTEPVGLAWAPDGRIFIWEKGGMVWILKDGALLPEPFLDIRDHVNSAHDRGLLGFALDPGFATNGYVYLLYVFEPGTANKEAGPRRGRLTRMRADPARPDRALAGSETVLLGAPDSACAGHAPAADCIAMDVDSHSAGALLFAPDGKLFVSLGDGSSYTEPDPTSFRAQDLDRYEGKLLRINPDGSAPGDNPFDDGTQSVRSRIYAYGLRNPFRFGLDARGEPYIGDVGSNRFEEINRGRGGNFGWPCWEGPEPHWFRVSSPGFEDCRKLDSTSAKTEKPVFAYDRSMGTCVIGGDFNTGSGYPDSMRGDFFFADHGAGKLFRLRLDAAGSPLGASEFAAGVGGPVCLRFGPDGCLYFVAYTEGGIGEIHRIRYEEPAASIPPSARARGRSGALRARTRRIDGLGRRLEGWDGEGRIPRGGLQGTGSTPVFLGE